MSDLTSAVILVLGLGLYLYTCTTSKLGKGKYFTKPVQIWVARVLWRKVERDGISLPLAFVILLVCDPGSFRLVIQTQVLVCGAFALMLGFGVDHAFTYYWIVMGVLCADDLLTNTDKPKKWWQAARNKIKWKMQLPVPVPSSG